MRVFSGTVWGLAIGVVLALSSCGTRQGTPTPSVGSESHFLTSCSATCAQGFECLCGVCTARCVEASECQEYYPSAECVSVSERPAASSCDGSEARAFCDVRCELDADCVGLGDAFSCQFGFCREEAQPTSESGRIELDELCDFYANDKCRVETECYGYNYGSDADCLAQQECAGWELLNRALGAGTVSFDPVATDACHQRLAEDACALPLFFSSPSLPQALAACGALAGRVPVGGSCEASVECTDGNCDTSATCPGVCVAANPGTALGSLGEGEACTTVICLDLDDVASDNERCEQCAEGLQCYQEVCRPEWQVGEACDSTSACRPQGWCDTEQGVCVRLSREGETCQSLGFTAPACEAGLFCYADSLDTGTCVPLGGEGDPCVEDYHCPEPLRCLPNGPDSDLGTCGPPAALGSPCQENEDCQNGFCSQEVCAEPGPGLPCIDNCLNCDLPCGIDTGLTCSDGTCAIDTRPGESCTEGDFCLESTCLAGVCTVRSYLGEACAEGADCLSGRCTDGVCADSASCR